MQRVRDALHSNLQTKASVQQHIAAVQAVPANYAAAADMQTADFAALIGSTDASAHADR